MNVVALVLTQFVALPTPLTIPPGGPLLIRANVTEGSAAEFNGRTVVAFTSLERQVATRIPVVAGGDLWIATWDGVAVTSRLLCPASNPRFREAHLAATANRVLIVSQMTTGVSAVMLDAALQPISVPCGTQLSPDQTTSLRVTASGDSFLVTYQSNATGMIVSRWVSPLGVFGNELSWPANAAVPARPSPLANDAGVLVVFRAATGANLTALQVTPAGATSATAAGSTAHGSWTATSSTAGPLLVAWTAPPMWELVATDLFQGTRLATRRVWSTGSASIPPAPLVLSPDAGIGVFSWLPGATAAAQFDVLATPAPPTVFLPGDVVPVAVAPPSTLITREINAFSLRTALVAGGQVGAVRAFVHERPSHQRSVNVAWTPLGWLVLWEEPRTLLAGAVPQTAIRAVLTDGRAANVNELVVQAVPGRSPRLRRRPSSDGSLLASFERPDGGTTIVTLTVTPPTLVVGNPVVGDIGPLGGFEVNATELVRWTPGTAASTDVYLGPNVVTFAMNASSRGAFAADTFWLPRYGLAQPATAFTVPTGTQLATNPFGLRSVEDEIAVGAAPYDSPSELFYAWNERDAGLVGVLQVAPPTNEATFSFATSRFLGGRPVRIGGRWMVGVRQAAGPVRALILHPTISTPVLFLGPNSGEVVEFESAEAPDGGEAAFVWTSWEDEGLDAGLRLAFQVVRFVGDGGVADAGAPDAGADAGLPDAGLPDAGLPDAGVADAGLADAGLADAGLADAGDQDAGADAGAPGDGGATDGGTADAGSTDAGPGGPADGGATALTFVPASCGCQSSEGALGLLALAVILARRARRV